MSELQWKPVIINADLTSRKFKQIVTAGKKRIFHNFLCWIFEAELFIYKLQNHQKSVQSDQLKNVKFYENSSEYANFSKSSGQDHKTKGQIL